MTWNGIELHVGDKVRLTDHPVDWNCKMDMYIGKIVTINNIFDYKFFFTVIPDFGDEVGGWMFFVSDIAAVVDKITPNYEELCYKGSELTPPGTTAKIKIGNLEINLTDKTFTDEQIKNMKEMLGWDVVNLVEV